MLYVLIHSGTGHLSGSILDWLEARPLSAQTSYAQPKRRYFAQGYLQTRRGRQSKDGRERVYFTRYGH